jgi:hypothetical protein
MRRGASRLMGRMTGWSWTREVTSDPLGKLFATQELTMFPASLSNKNPSQPIPQKALPMSASPDYQPFHLFRVFRVFRGSLPFKFRVLSRFSRLKDPNPPSQNLLDRTYLFPPRPQIPEVMPASIVAIATPSPSRATIGNGRHFQTFSQALPAQIRPHLTVLKSPSSPKDNRSAPAASPPAPRDGGLPASSGSRANASVSAPPIDRHRC